jgi:hypothetical protein
MTNPTFTLTIPGGEILVTIDEIGFERADWSVGICGDAFWPESWTVENVLTEDGAEILDQDQIAAWLNANPDRRSALDFWLDSEALSEALADWTEGSE